MRRNRGSVARVHRTGGIRRVVAVVVITAAAAAGLVVAEGVAPAPASAATVLVQPWMDVRARFSEHRGYTAAYPDGTANPQTSEYYKFGSAANSVTSGTIPNTGGTSAPSPGTALVSEGSTTWTAHGRGSGGVGIGTPLDLDQQSALGFQPASLGSSIETGVPFNLGRVIHRNNVIGSTPNVFFQGNLLIDALTTTLVYRWQMHETPNTCGDDLSQPCDDVVSFLNQTAPSYYIDDSGALFTIVLGGFTAPQGPGDSCDATLPDLGGTSEEFVTEEVTVNYACLYATLEVVHQLTVTKAVDSPYVSPAPAAPYFDFSTTSTLPGGELDGGGFQLTEGDTQYLYFSDAEQVVVLEEPSSGPWVFGSVSCVDGAGDPIPEITLSGAEITIPAGVPAAEIDCVYRNVYEPRATLTLVKVVDSGADPAPASPADWDLAAAGQDAVAAVQVAGAAGSPEVEQQSVIAGEYLLSETSDDPDATLGYLQDGDWVCETAAGAPVALSGPARITLALDDDVTCTATNVFASGTLRVTKTVTTVPAGGYLLGTSGSFLADYSCSPRGPVGQVEIHPSAVDGTAGAPVIASDAVPAGSVCTVTEADAPTGTSEGLVDGTWTWDAPEEPAAVTVASGATETLDIENVASRSSTGSGGTGGAGDPGAEPTGSAGGTPGAGLAVTGGDPSGALLLGAGLLALGTLLVAARRRRA